MKLERDNRNPKPTADTTRSVTVEVVGPIKETLAEKVLTHVIELPVVGPIVGGVVAGIIFEQGKNDIREDS